MRTRFLLLAVGLALATAHNAFADRGVVNDPDGFTHLRAAPNRESAIVATAKSGEVVEFERSNSSDWWAVTLDSGKKGFMHSSRIRPEENGTESADAGSTNERFVSSAKFQLAAGVTLFVRASQFDASKHSVRNVKGEMIIDGHQVMGVDGSVPTTRLEEAYLVIRDKKIPLETSSMYDPWSSAPSKDQFKISWMEDEPQKDHSTASSLTVSASFSDGAGGYEVQWKVVEGTSLRVAIGPSS
jgi:hypothetical protein